MAGNSTDAGRSVSSKVTAISMVFADGDVHTLTEIAASADLLTSTAHRLASELVARRLLERTEEPSYRIGLPLRIIASEYCESELCSQTVMRALVPYSAWLARLGLILSPKLQGESGRPDWDRPDLDCEPQQARAIPRNLELDETVVVLFG